MKGELKMFKQGDIVAGIDGNGYMTAGKGMTRGEVVYTRGYPVTMGVRVLEHTDPTEIGRGVEVENRSTMFKLVS